MRLWNLPCEDISFWPHVELFEGWMEDCDTTEPWHNSTSQGSPKLSSTAHPSIYCGCNSGTPRAAWCSHGSAIAGYRWEAVLEPQDTVGQLLLGILGIASKPWRWINVSSSLGECWHLAFKQWGASWPWQAEQKPCSWQCLQSYPGLSISKYINKIHNGNKLNRTP